MPPDERKPEFTPADPWQVTSYLIAGVVLFGGLGWLADQWLGTTFLVAVGIVVGAGLATYLVWLRLNASAGPHDTGASQHPDDPTRR